METRFRYGKTFNICTCLNRIWTNVHLDSYMFKYLFFYKGRKRGSSCFTLICTSAIREKTTYVPVKLMMGYTIYFVFEKCKWTDPTKTWLVHRIAWQLKSPRYHYGSKVLDVFIPSVGVLKSYTQFVLEPMYTSAWVPNFPLPNARVPNFTPLQARVPNSPLPPTRSKYSVCF